MAVRFVAALVTAWLCFPAVAQNLESVDFENFEYPLPDWHGWHGAWRWLEEIPASTVRLRDGRSDIERGGYLDFESIERGDLDGDGQAEAAVDLRRGAGGTASWHYLYVFHLAEGNTELVAMLESGERSNGGLFNVQIEDGLLVLDFLDADRARGLCCSDGFIRVRYRLEGNRFVETGEREKDSLRVYSYPLLPQTGPQTVRNVLNGGRNDVVYTDSNGIERILATLSSYQAEPDLSGDQRSVVFLRRAGGEQEIWTVRTDGSGETLLHRGPLSWNDEPCPSSSIRTTKWSPDGRVVYFVTDCTATEGAIWRLDVDGRVAAPFIPDGVQYGVIKTGWARGFLIASQRTHPSPDDRYAPEYPTYPYYLFTPGGRRLGRVGHDWEFVEDVLPRWEGL